MRAGLRSPRRRRERRVRRARAVCGALPVRDVAPPESPRACVRDPLGCGRGALARILKGVLGRMDRVLDDPSFNYYIHTAPVREPEGTFHLHLEITPRLTEIAGFERGTGFYINPVVPEDAAAILKGEIRWSARSEASTP